MQQSNLSLIFALVLFVIIIISILIWYFYDRQKQKKEERAYINIDKEIQDIEEDQQE